MNPLEKGTVKIVNLRTAPECIPTIAVWLLEEFEPFSPSSTKASYMTFLEASCGASTIPFSLVAIDDGRPVATVSVVESDMPQRAQYTPWLSCLYVVPSMRGLGIGSRLVQCSLEEARLHGIEDMYLYTGNAEKLYDSLGWSVRERLVHQSMQVTLMNTKTSSEPRCVTSCPE